MLPGVLVLCWPPNAEPGEADQSADRRRFRRNNGGGPSKRPRVLDWGCAWIVRSEFWFSVGRPTPSQGRQTKALIDGGLDETTVGGLPNVPGSWIGVVPGLSPTRQLHFGKQHHGKQELALVGSIKSHRLSGSHEVTEDLVQTQGVGQRHQQS